MSSPKVIEACQSLFSITSYLAHGILPALRIEDIKIALAKQLHRVTPTAPGALPKNTSDKTSRCVSK